MGENVVTREPLTGRIIRELTDHEISKLQASADSYVNNALRYQEQLVEL